METPVKVPREETTTYFLEEVESPEPEVPRGLRPSAARGGLFMPEKTLGAGIQQSLDLLYGGPVLRRSKVPTLEGSSNNNQDQKQHREQQQHQQIQQRPSTSNHHKAAMKTSNKYLDFGGSLDMGNRKGSSVENFVAKSSKHLQQMISSVAAASVIPATQSAPPVKSEIIHAIPASVIIGRLENMRTKLCETIAEIDALKAEFMLPEQQQQRPGSFSD